MKKIKRLLVANAAILVIAVVGTKVDPYSTAFVPVDIVAELALMLAGAVTVPFATALTL